MTTALAAILLLIGFGIRKKVSFLTKYCIPAPVVGGFLFMFITFAGHQSGAFAFKFDTTFQSPFMVAFFTTVGLGASLSLLKKGGILLIVYWLIAGIVSIIQNCISIGLANVTGLEYPYALLAGAISMIGGHGAAGSYGSTFTEMGYPAGITVGAAAATFGLIFGVLVGGPVARMLIEKNHLTPDNSETLDTSIEEINAGHGEKLTNLDVLKNVTAILFYRDLRLDRQADRNELPVLCRRNVRRYACPQPERAVPLVSFQIPTGGRHWRCHAEPVSFHGADEPEPVSAA